MADKVQHCPPSDPSVVAWTGNPNSSLMGGGPSAKLPLKRHADDYMVYRRFGCLQNRAWVRRQQAIYGHEQIANSMWNYDDDDDLPLPIRGRQTANRKQLKWFIAKIEGPLHPFNSFVLRSEALKRAPPPGIYHYKSNREYLYHGPAIYMNYCEIQDNRWSDYEAVVKKILQDPETTQWLDSPLDPDWRKSAEQLWHERRGKGADDTTWLLQAKKKLHRLVPGIVLLFWILHITAALAFPLIARNSTLKSSSEPEVNFFKICLLAYWYLSAVGIVVQGFLDQGFVYFRKVLLGGISTCFGGFYIIYIWMGISAASSCAAIPSLFTIVLLLIRSM